jgi:general secretion pathway protein K
MIAATQKKKVAVPGAAGAAGAAGATGAAAVASAPASDKLSDAQQSNQSPSDTQPMEIAQVDDLLAIPEFSAEMLNKIRDWIVVLPRATPVNVNTASAEVLEARLDTITGDTITAADAAALVASRKIASFRPADFATRLPGRTLSTSAISFGSEYFLVNGKVRMNRAALEAQALIERNATTYATAVIWIREN